ncbi:MAG: glycosyltransferase involved in cell wall biosynthesis [Pirellulaceae bacterium]|jgi:glycosyltransferase involved in cell wall biosynthesis
MIIGGAQENTLYNCRDLQEEFGDDVLLITGPAFGPEGDLLNGERGQGIRTEYVPSLRRAIHPWRDWRSLRHLKKIIRAFGPDVVHTHSAKGGFLGRLAAHSLRVPAIVHTVHGAPFHPFQSSLARTIFKSCEKYAAKRCHAMISVADAMTNLMVQANVAPRDKFTTIYSGMEVETFLKARVQRTRVRQQLGLANDDVAVGKIARLAPLKGHDSLIAAAEKSLRENRHLKFILIGDGQLQVSLQRQIAEAGLNDAFRFIGLVSPENIPELLGAMDILVHTSLREGLARCLPQALLAGVPTIAFDIDGAGEVVISGETGELIPPLDTEQLSNAILKLSADSALRTRLGQNGMARFQLQFDHRNMTRQVRALYETVLTSSGSRIWQ